MRPFSSLVIAILSLSTIAGSAFSVRASDGFFMGLGDLPGGEFDSIAFAVSGDGRVVVGASVVEGSVGRAFRWTQAEGIQNLGTITRDARAVSYDGSVIVGHRDIGGSTYVYRWTQSTGAVTLDDSFIYAGGVSYDGSLITADRRLPPTQWYEACLVAGETIFPLGDLPGGFIVSDGSAISGDGTTVVGGSASAAGYEVFRWTAQTGMVGLGDQPGGAISGTATSVSADGSVIVGYGDDQIPYRAFRWTTSTGFVGLGSLTSGRHSLAQSVSADGSVVVGVSDCDVDQSCAFIWDVRNHNGMRKLQDVLFARDPTLVPPGWVLGDAQGVSADGRIVVGGASNPNGNGEAFIAKIPCCATDLDCNENTDLDDLSILLSHFGQCSGNADFYAPADIDGRGCVDLPDLARLLSTFGESCP